MRFKWKSWIWSIRKNAHADIKEAHPLLPLLSPHPSCPVLPHPDINTGFSSSPLSSSATLGLWQGPPSYRASPGCQLGCVCCAYWGGGTRPEQLLPGAPCLTPGRPAPPVPTAAGFPSPAARGQGVAGHRAPSPASAPGLAAVGPGPASSRTAVPAEAVEGGSCRAMTPGWGGSAAFARERPNLGAFQPCPLLALGAALLPSSSLPLPLQTSRLTLSITGSTGLGI